MKKYQIKREYIIGIVIIVIAILFFWGIYFLKNTNVFSKQVEFVSKYEKIPGLLKDNPVVINGLRVGKVKDLGLMPNNSGMIYVKVVLYKKIKIPTNSEMLIINSDLLGAKAVEIVLGNSKTYANSGDTLSSKVTKSLQEEVNAQVLPIKIKAEQLMASFDTLLTSLRSILNENTQENLRRSFEAIRFSIGNIQDVTFNLDTLITSEKNRVRRISENIESITANFKTNNSKLNNIINNFSSISDSLSKVHLVQTIHDADKAVRDFSLITDKINKGKGSMGMLINNDSLYNNLQSSADEMKKLLEDMRLNPDRYVHFSIFGKRSPPYKNPEKKQK